MPSTLPQIHEIDKILALQFLVAWAGESAEDPTRLGWWQSDLIDPLSGGDFFKRLLPRTHNWAALQAARELAKNADAKARAQLPNPDKLRTLYFWGYELDHRLEERLNQLKLDGTAPEAALVFPFELGSEWDQGAFTTFLQSLHSSYDYTTKREGREVKNPNPHSP